MGPPSYMRSVVEKNLVMRRIPLYEFEAELLYSQNFTNAKRFAVPTYARRLAVPPSVCARSWVLPLTNLAGDQAHQLTRYWLWQIVQDRQQSLFCDVLACRTCGVTGKRFPTFREVVMKALWYLQVSGRKSPTSFTAADPEYVNIYTDLFVDLFNIIFPVCVFIWIVWREDDEEEEEAK
jgi:hypothetical protein